LRGNLITVKIKDEEIYRKCKFLVRITGLVIETLLEILFERVDVVDLQRAYIEGDVEGVKRLIRESLSKGEGRKGEGVEEPSLDGKKRGSKVKNLEVRSRLDADSFW
jgi:hypothetical protein